jgi:hypothetical protein
LPTWWGLSESRRRLSRRSHSYRCSTGPPARWPPRSDRSGVRTSCAWRVIALQNLAHEGDRLERAALTSFHGSIDAKVVIRWKDIYERLAIDTCRHAGGTLKNLIVTVSWRRVIFQLTLPGSACSIVIGEGIVPDMPPGSLKGLQLVVADLHAAHAQLKDRGVEVSEIQVVGASPTAQEDPLDNVGFLFLSDPDGNGWAVQHISSRG